MSLENVKVGDLVMVCRQLWPDSMERVTEIKRRKIKVGGRYYRQDNGMMAGNYDLGRSYIKALTDADKIRINEETKRRILIRDLGAIRLYELSTKTLEAIKALTESATK